MICTCSLGLLAPCPRRSGPRFIIALACVACRLVLVVLGCSRYVVGLYSIAPISCFVSRGQSLVHIHTASLPHDQHVSACHRPLHLILHVTVRFLCPIVGGHIRTFVRGTFISFQSRHLARPRRLWGLRIELRLLGWFRCSPRLGPLQRLLMPSTGVSRPPPPSRPQLRQVGCLALWVDASRCCRRTYPGRTLSAPLAPLSRPPPCLLRIVNCQLSIVV
jgi:hypothetical protein